jgi:undecaprenyl diphosphate synthase
VAIIMDGNGRWARARGRPRTTGHLAGARTVRRTVEAAARLGVGALTLYAFSGDNWRRPSAEVEALMRIFRRYLAGEVSRCVENGIGLTVIGRRDRLPTVLVGAIEAAERETAGGRRMRLRIALDYSARDAILRAAGGASADGALTREGFAERLAAASHDEGSSPDVDLLIRTGGEKRLSDFLLWECAYAELHFTPRLWPDFSAGDLEDALRVFARRDRRFGGLSSAVAG